VDFAADEVDVAIRHGRGDWPGLHATRLWADAAFPVCSPALLRGKRPLRSAVELRHHVLLHLDDRQQWADWLKKAGVEGIDLERGPIFDQSGLAIDAASSGQGVALGRTALVAEDLLAGRLICPFGPVIPMQTAYWIVCPKATAAQPKIAAFRAWITAEAEAELRSLESRIPS
jgi:LysR family glycine cleavage system transcriptional activator